MTRIFDAILDLWDWLMRLCGFRARGGPPGLPERRIHRQKQLWRLAIRPIIVIVVLLYCGALVWKFGFIRGEDLTYPQKVLAAAEAVAPPATVSGQEETQPESGTEQIKTCGRSRTVDMQINIIDQMVNQNGWVPASPLYKFGLFGLVEWEATPFFDNKAAFQLGMLAVTRRMAVDLSDTLGRVRGTSRMDSDLQAAQAKLRQNEQSWVVNNPFNSQLTTLTVSAASSYRGAIPLYERYNARLADCDALFDARADNLRVSLDRITSDLGSIAEQLNKRSQGEVYDPASDVFVKGTGNNRGWFDMRADNLFHEARGRMYALHGLMQAMRLDFAEVIAARDLDDVWDRMEQHVAEAAVMKPFIVSNGKPDGLMVPDHLSVMAGAILRARSNMVEMRDILDR